MGWVGSGPYDFMSAQVILVLTLEFMDYGLGLDNWKSWSFRYLVINKLKAKKSFSKKENKQVDYDPQQ